MRTFARLCIAALLATSLAACTDREVLESVAGVVELRCAGWVAPSPEEFLTRVFSPSAETSDGQSEFAESVKQVMQYVPALCALSDGLNTTPKELIVAYADLLEQHPEYFQNSDSALADAGLRAQEEGDSPVTSALGDNRLMPPDDAFYYLDSTMSDVGINDEEDVRISVVRGETYVLHLWRQNEDVDIGPYSIFCANSPFTYSWNGRLLEPREYKVMDHNCHISLHVNNPFGVEWQIMLLHSSS